MELVMRSLRDCNEIPGCVCIFRKELSRKDMMNVSPFDALSIPESQLIEKAISAQDIIPKIFPSVIVELFVCHDSSGYMCKQKAPLEPRSFLLKLTLFREIQREPKIIALFVSYIVAQNSTTTYCYLLSLTIIYYYSVLFIKSVRIMT